MITNRLTGSILDQPPHLPINFYSEDFIAGFQPRNRMSVVRRFFCLFVTFDLVFVALLWLICIAINGENILEAMKNQIVNYTIQKSLFDVVAIAAARFAILILFYAMIQINHWIIIAFTTTFSCCFLITKVYFYSWPPTQPVFQVLLIIISFVISWFEAWFLDSRMIPQEDYSRSLTQGELKMIKILFLFQIFIFLVWKISYNKNELLLYKVSCWPIKSLILLLKNFSLNSSQCIRGQWHNSPVGSILQCRPPRKQFLPSRKLSPKFLQSRQQRFER